MEGKTVTNIQLLEKFSSTILIFLSVLRKKLTWPRLTGENQTNFNNMYTWERENCQHPLGQRKSKGIKENIYFCFIGYAKAFGCVDHNKLWEILKEIRMPDHLNNFLRDLCARQEGIVRTRHGTMDWFQICKGVRQYCHLAYLTCM